MIILINNNKIKILKKKYTNYTIKYIQTDTICLSANNILIDNNLKQNINSSIYFINIKNSRSINIIRHSCSHLLAHAISKIYKIGRAHV